MRAVIMDIEGRVHELPPVSLIRWDRHALRCGDRVRLEVPGAYAGAEPETLRLYDAEDRVVFRGNVDYASAEYSPDGILLKIEGRSSAAAMEDNEAVPASYANQSVSDVFARHALPYGMTAFAGTDKVLPGEFRVAVGDSEWMALVKFCRALNGHYPQIRGETVDFGPFEPMPARVFSNRGEPGDIPFLRAAVRADRKKYISQILTRTLASDVFDLPISNRLGAERFIRRRRVMRYRDLNQTQKLRAAHLYMDRARAGSLSAVLMLEGEWDIPLRSPASFVDEHLGTLTDYAVAGVTFQADSFARRTYVTLWPRDDLL